MPSTPTGEHALAGVDAPVRFGKYTLLTRLATGGMGEVYVAQMGGAAGFEKQVVIKRILPQLANDEQFVRMFLDEARITAQLNHPNICQVFELGEIQGEYYIAMEYLEGLPLSRLIHKHSFRGIDLRVVAGIMVQACEGLAYAHDFRDPTRRIDGVVHRDVSPQNLFVTAPGLVKVLDFGVAKLYREGSKTVTVSSKGKHLYMSPEQVNGEPIDQRSDLFALAAVMFEALTGRNLFGRATQFLTLQAIVTGDRPRIREVRSDVPAAVEEVFERALSLNPADRFPTGRALAEALAFALSSMGGPASIIELAHFVQREHVDELSSERQRIRRASAWVQSSRASSELLPMPTAEDDLSRIEGDLDVIDEQDADDAAETRREYSGEYTDEHSDEHSDHGRYAGQDALDQPTIEAPARLTPSPSSVRPVAFVRLNAQHEVADYFDLRTQRWRRYLRWAVVATITLAAALWFGRDLLGFDVWAMIRNAVGSGDGATADVPAQPAGAAATPGAGSDTKSDGTSNAGAGGASSPGQGTRPGTGPDGETDNRPAVGRVDQPPPAAGAALPATTGQRPGANVPAGGEPAVAPPAGSQPAPGSSGSSGSSGSAGATGVEPGLAEEQRDLADGYFTVDAQPYAEIFIDGKKMGLTPLVKIPLEPGRHRVRAVAVETGETEAFRIQISSKKVVTKQITFTDD
jgi:serine/threonine protein kinase